MNQSELRSAVAAGLELAGDPDLAARAANPRSTMIGRQRELPGGALAVLFEAFPHPGASFYAGLAGGLVFHLTGRPAAFAEMIRASGLQIADEQTAAQIAREYVETTRTFYRYACVLDSADDIEWDTRREPAPELVARLRASVRPPAATAAGPWQYQVSLFVLNGAAVEHRVLSVTTDGAVAERIENVAAGLPVPYSF